MSRSKYGRIKSRMPVTSDRNGVCIVSWCRVESFLGENDYFVGGYTYRLLRRRSHPCGCTGRLSWWQPELSMSLCRNVATVEYDTHTSKLTLRGLYEAHQTLCSSSAQPLNIYLTDAAGPGQNERSESYVKHCTPTIDLRVTDRC